MFPTAWSHLRLVQLFAIRILPWMRSRAWQFPLFPLQKAVRLPLSLSTVPSLSARDRPSRFVTSFGAYAFKDLNIPFMLLGQKQHTVFRWGCTNTRYSGKITFWLPISFAPWLLGCTAGSCWACCHEHPRSLSAEPLQPFISHLCLCLVLLCPRGRT